MGPPAGIDHLLFAAPTLAAGIEEIEARLGTRPVPGGRHPSFGTHNALVALGPEVYLEVIAPDPTLPAPTRGVGFGVGGVEKPRLITWAVRSGAIAATASAAGLGDVQSGQRERPDGRVLRWRLSDPYAERDGGVVPFLIDWGSSAHPAESAPSAGSLIDVRLRHPNPAGVRERLRLLGLDLDVTAASEPGLVAVVESAAGRVELR